MSRNKKGEKKNYQKNFIFDDVSIYQNVDESIEVDILNKIKKLSWFKKADKKIYYLKWFWLQEAIFPSAFFNAQKKTLFQTLIVYRTLKKWKRNNLTTSLEISEMLRPAVFQPNLKFFHAKVTVSIVVSPLQYEEYGFCMVFGINSNV